jgi:hypothetical protein
MGNLKNSPLKIKEKTLSIGKGGSTSKRERKRSQITPKLITPICTIVLDLEEIHIHTKSPS